MSAVAVPGRCRLAADVQSTPRSIRCHQCERSFLRFVVSIECAAVIDAAAKPIELFDQRTAAVQAVENQVLRIGQSLNLKPQFAIGAVAPVRVVGGAAFVDGSGHGLVSRTEPARVFARSTEDESFLNSSERVWQHDIAGQVTRVRFGGLAEICGNDRAHRRPIVGRRVEAPADRDLPGMACLQVVAGRAVVVIRMAHRPDDAELVRDSGRPRQVLTDPQPGRAAGDRAERSADGVRGLGFQIEGLELARAAEQKQEDDGASFGRPNGGRVFCGGNSCERCA